MSSISDWLDSYPLRLSVLTAAVAPTSSLVFPGVLIPENMEFLGPFGSIFTVLLLLVTWVMRKEFWRYRKPLFAVTGTLSLVALLTLVNLNRKYVVTAELPEPRKLLIGHTLTPWGAEKLASANTVSMKTYIETIGEEAIPQAWGDSFQTHSNVYTFAYLALGAGLLLMTAVALTPPRSTARRGEAKQNVDQPRNLAKSVTVE
jgi:hypothetical protein